MNANTKNEALIGRAARSGVSLTWNAASTLRRAAITLSRWAENECGNSDDYKSWSIERDEVTEKPFMVIHPHNDSKSRRYAIADRETGALKRAAAVCKESGLFFYHQTDPRGVSLYVSNVELTDQNYNARGVACEV